MSSKEQSSHQSTMNLSHDWAHVADEDLEVYMDDSEATEEAKEAEKAQMQEQQAKKDRQARVHAAREAAEAEAQWCKSAMAKSWVEALRSEGRSPSVMSTGTVVDLATARPTKPMAKVEASQCGPCKAAVGSSGPRKRAGTSSSRGERKKRGHSGDGITEGEEELGDEGEEAVAENAQEEVGRVHEVDLATTRFYGAVTRSKPMSTSEYSTCMIDALEQLAVAGEWHASASEQLVAAVEQHADAAEDCMAAIWQGHLWSAWLIRPPPDRSGEDAEEEDRDGEAEEEDEVGDEMEED
ncbi:hypothetical protein EDC04DRAFT_2601918 [Pisolithus marmoratus]|nr:hypothetical protein EDC04DRAFT_2601918 [Pisolithus marmoratus]